MPAHALPIFLGCTWICVGVVIFAFKGSKRA
jgi:hypothetical protein